MFKVGKKFETHLDIPLKVKEVDSLPVATIQSENVPRLRVKWERLIVIALSLIVALNTGTRRQTHTAMLTCTHPHPPHPPPKNTDSPVRLGHSDRVSPHPERRRFWKTDRDGLETPDPPLPEASSLH